MLQWFSATREEKAYSTVMTGMKKYTWQGHCMYCGHCVPCSTGIDIAGVNKYFNLTIAQDIIPETMHEHYVPLKHHASEYIVCGNYEPNYPFRVDIIGHMEKASARFGY